MRKSFIGLTALVRNELEDDPLSGHVFGFSNRRRNLIKLLVWDGSGYWVLAKRLPRGTFSWPRVGDTSHELTQEELTLLLSGIDVTATKQRDWHRLRMSS
jgi:transposase